MQLVEVVELIVDLPPAMEHRAVGGARCRIQQIPATIHPLEAGQHRAVRTHEVPVEAVRTDPAGQELIAGDVVPLIHVLHPLSAARAGHTGRIQGARRTALLEVEARAENLLRVVLHLDGRVTRHDRVRTRRRDREAVVGLGLVTVDRRIITDVHGLRDEAAAIAGGRSLHGDMVDRAATRAVAGDIDRVFRTGHRGFIFMMITLCVRPVDIDVILRRVAYLIPADLVAVMLEAGRVFQYVKRVGGAAETDRVFVPAQHLDLRRTEDLDRTGFGEGIPRHRMDLDRVGVGLARLRPVTGCAVVIHEVKMIVGRRLLTARHIAGGHAALLFRGQVDTHGTDSGRQRRHRAHRGQHHTGCRRQEKRTEFHPRCSFHNMS